MTTTRIRRRTAFTAAGVLVVALPLAACSAPDDDVELPSVTSPEATGPGTDDGTTEPSPTTDTTPTPSDGATGDAGDATAAVLRAIELAEQEAGGTAFEVEHEDKSQGDGVWEVSVAVGDDEVELRISFDGTEVLRSRPDGPLSAEERGGLDAAQVTVADAITTALGEVDGVFDEVEIERYGDGYAWEVSIEHGGGDDTDVYVDVATGEVLKVDD